MISHHFPHIQTLFGLHPRLSWEKTRHKFNETTCTNMENYWGLLQYPWMKIHPAKYNNWLQYFTMNTTLTKWLINGFAKHQTRLEFQYFIPLRKSTNRLNWETSGVSGPTEKLSAFVAILLQPLAQQQKSYLKDWYSQLPPLISLTGLKFQRAQYFSESLDVTSLYTNIPQQREYIQYARHTTLSILKDTPPIPTRLLDKRSG